MALQDILIAAGAPILKSIIADRVGGLGGKLASAAIDALAKAFSTPERSVAPTPEAIAQEFDADPGRGTAVIQRVEQDASENMARIYEANRDVMVGYQKVLLADGQQEGWIARNWRPVFALVFTLCFAGITLTSCRAIWLSQLDGFEKIAGTIALIILGGCAVLGVQVWQRSEEKKAGV